jgi:hypothetical protein
MWYPWKCETRACSAIALEEDHLSRYDLVGLLGTWESRDGSRGLAQVLDRGPKDVGQVWHDASVNAMALSGNVWFFLRSVDNSFEYRDVSRS